MFGALVMVQEDVLELAGSLMVLSPTSRQHLNDMAGAGARWACWNWMGGLMVRDQRENDNCTIVRGSYTGLTPHDAHKSITNHYHGTYDSYNHLYKND